MKIKMCHEMPPDEIGKQLDVICEKFTQEIANMSAQIAQTSMKIDQLALLAQKIHEENKSLQVLFHMILSNVAVGSTSPSAAAAAATTTTPCVTVAATVPSPPVSPINKIPPSNVFSLMKKEGHL